MKNKRKFKLKHFIAWLIIIGVIFVLYRLKPEFFSLIVIEELFNDYKIIMVLIYLFILSILGLFFIPSTPFAIAGVFIFSPAEAYIFNLIGIVTSSTIVYYFAKYLGLDQAMKEKYPKQIKKTKKTLQHKELPIIASWSFFPIVPTDLMIYVASTLNISYRKCLLGVLLGEGLLNAFYIFSTLGLT